MSRTVGGKPFEAALKQLREARPPKEDKGNTGFSYYSIEAFISAMDDALGCEGYSFSYSEPIYRVLKNEQEMISVRCSLSIYADDGSILKRTEGFGDKEVMVSKEKGRVDVGNLTASAATLAFKDACKYLGIFGYRTTGEDTGGKTARAGSSQKATAKDEVKIFVVKQMFYEQGESRGYPILKLPVEADCGKGEVIFYHNQTSSDAETFNSLYSHVEKSLGKGTVTVKLKVKPSGERDGLKQFVFKSFVA
jgi:hypothetical protein